MSVGTGLVPGDFWFRGYTRRFRNSVAVARRTLRRRGFVKQDFARIHQAHILVTGAAADVLVFSLQGEACLVMVNQ